MRARSHVIVAAIAGSALIAMPLAGPAHAATYESKIRLKYNDDGAFSGAVTSTSDKCHANRAVKIVRKQEGENDVLTRTVTGEDGTFAVFVEKGINGDFYAVVLESAAGDDLCDRDRSNTVTV